MDNHFQSYKPCTNYTGRQYYKGLEGIHSLIHSPTLTANVQLLKQLMKFCLWPASKSDCCYGCHVIPRSAITLLGFQPQMSRSPLPSQMITALGEAQQRVSDAVTLNLQNRTEPPRKLFPNEQSSLSGLSASIGPRWEQGMCTSQHLPRRLCIHP